MGEKERLLVFVDGNGFLGVPLGWCQLASVVMGKGTLVGRLIAPSRAVEPVPARQRLQPVLSRDRSVGRRGVVGQAVKKPAYTLGEGATAVLPVEASQRHLPALVEVGRSVPVVPGVGHVPNVLTGYLPSLEVIAQAVDAVRVPPSRRVRSAARPCCISCRRTCCSHTTSIRRS